MAERKMMQYKPTVDEKVLAEWALTKQKHQKGNGLIQRILVIAIIALVAIYLIFRVKFFIFMIFPLGFILVTSLIVDNFTIKCPACDQSPKRWKNQRGHPIHRDFCAHCFHYLNRPNLPASRQ